MTDDPATIEASTKALAFMMLIEIPDAIACEAQAVLRGIGRQRFGGWVNIIVWPLISVPISLVLGVKMGLGVGGLWTGAATGMATYVICPSLISCRTSQRRC